MTTAPTSGGVLAQGALSHLPAGLRGELLRELAGIVENFRRSRWGPAELNGGRLCEVVYTVLRGYVDGSYPSRASKPSDMVGAWRALERAGASVPRSVRIQIPRVLMALYEIRNNRGVGHVGGDVDPNHMDAVAVLTMSKWVVAELVRIFHGLDTQSAAAVVDALVEREVPAIWEVGERRRVLLPKLSMKQKTLLLLYGHSGPVDERVLVDWVEHSNATVYRRDVLRPLHKEKAIEYDQRSHEVHLSPVGAKVVEDEILTA